MEDLFYWHLGVVKASVYELSRGDDHSLTLTEAL